MMRSKRKGLTPYKIILVFLIAFILVSIHEMDRIMGWLEGSALESGADSQTLESYSKGRETIRDLGLDRVIEAEKEVLSFTENLPVIGEVVKKTESEVQKGARLVTAPVESWEFMASVGEIFLRSTAKLQQPDNPPVRVAAEVRETPPVIPAEPPAVRKKALPVENDEPVPAEPEVIETSVTPPGNQDEVVASPAPETTPVKVMEPATSGKLKPKTILIAGDSMILEGFGVALERKLKDFPGLDVVRKGKYSSGLSRPDYFDWMAYLKELLDEFKPDLLMVCLGANDPQDILDEKHKRHFVATETWNDVYARRAEEFLEIAGHAGTAVIWVGLPIMGKKTYGERIKNLNEVVQKVCGRKPDCRFVDSWQVLTNSKGSYTTFLKNKEGQHIRIRAKDKIHLTEKGGEILVTHVLSEVSDFVEFPKVKPGIETASARQKGPVVR